VYVPVPDYVTVRRNRKIRTSLYIKQKMLILGRVATYVGAMSDKKGMSGAHKVSSEQCEQ
jgi:hypothetical protein